MKYILLIVFSLIMLSGCNDTKEITNKETSYNEVIDDNTNISNSTEKPKEEPKEGLKEETKLKETFSNKDNVVINTFNNMEKEVDALLNSNDESVKDKAKGVFISLVDFIFYDGKINDITFNELTDKGKEKVLNIASNIDIKIENKFPSYKETISDKTSKAFNKASELIKKGARNINDFAYESLGEEYYNDIIEAKDELVKYTKNALSIIGSVGSDLIDKGTDALSKWYQNFKSQ